MEFWRRFEYKNTLLFILSLVLAYVITKYESFHVVLLSLDNLGYFGVFICGILYTFTFTAAPSVIVLLVLAEKLVLWKMVVVAAFGSVIGDVCIFGFFKNGLVKEIRRIFSKNMSLADFIRTRSKSSKRLLAVLGALILISPLPDELGVGLLGISDMPALSFAFLSLVLNVIGLSLVIGSSAFLKP